MANMMTPAEAEALEILIEECSEVIKAATKALRHGWEATADGVSYDNRNDIEVELGQLDHAAGMVIALSSLKIENIRNACNTKRADIEKWLHHGGGQ